MKIKQDEFSKQVIEEWNKGELTMLECIDKIRCSNGYLIEDIPKILSSNLKDLLQIEQEEMNTIAKSNPRRSLV